MHYKNFLNATYAPAGYLKNSPLEKIKSDIERVGKYIKFDKIYLETYRNETVEREKMTAVKKLFEENGYKTSGGITTAAHGTLMGSMCYTSPETRKLLSGIASYTAEIFDEIILDDFYFTNCRCESCIKAKGESSWASFRLALMNDISENVIIKSIKAVNPDAHIIIKYPNWYDSYQACGYNPEGETPMFDGIYAGTETRDPHYTHQNLQRYLSYFLPRLAERIKPGLNGGGWYDLYECSLEDYVCQAYLTLWSKCRENMLFCFPLLSEAQSVYMAAAGAVYDDADELMGKLGEPAGVACYKPYHSHGERHLYDFIGMLGIPLDPYPEYPSDAKTVILTECAAWDRDIIQRIKKTLLNGGKVFVTSGLYKKLENKGMQDIMPVEITDKKISSDLFTNNGYGMNTANTAKARGLISMPHIGYNTNDLWVLSAAQTPFESHPFLLTGEYGSGRFYVLNIPDLTADLYKLPAETLTLLRKELDLDVTLECGANIGIFNYDNDTFILQSFSARPEKVRIRIGKESAELVQIAPFARTWVEKSRSGKNESVFDVSLSPGRYAAFKYSNKGQDNI